LRNASWILIRQPTKKPSSKRLAKLRKTYDLVHQNYLETKLLLDEFRLIDPDLYHRASLVSDVEGNLTDVYVKLVDRNSGKFIQQSQQGISLAGYTSIGYWKQNPNINASAYGLYSIAVTIGNTYDKLSTLAHELGHVLYQVKNLSTYVKFFNKEYSQDITTKFGIGHHADDPAHTYVKSIENNFRQKLLAYQQVKHYKPHHKKFITRAE